MGDFEKGRWEYQMRILRVVSDYWPCVGGNERWSLLHDEWFSEVAGDDVQVVVLRPKDAFEFPGYADLLKGFRGKRTFSVPQLPKVRIHQEVFPDATRIRQVRLFWKTLRPYVANPSVDLVLTQISTPHAIPCWRGKPVVFEPPTLICPYGSHQNCTRSRFMCRTCWRQGGPAWWLRDQLKLASYSRFDLVAHNENNYADLKRVGLESRFHCLRFIIEPSRLWQPPRQQEEVRQKKAVDDFSARFPHVLFQFNRLFGLKNPHLLLDVAERLPSYGVIFGGGGPDQESLEARISGSDSLRDRVLFLGAVNADCLGPITERVSAFVLTSVQCNYNTSLCESMSLGNCPVAAVDTKDFPSRFYEDELILRTTSDPEAIARQLRELFENRDRMKSIALAAKRYIAERHSIDQMWAYRQRLLGLAHKYKSKR